MSIVDFSRAKSLWVINYFNSCGFMELLPWVSSGYDMERFGILPTASARHADVLIVAGYITTKGAKRVKRIYDQMPSPKFVLALGSCPMTGGMYWDSYNTVKNIEEVVPVDVWVLGCPPKPENIGHGIVMAMKAIEGGFKGHQMRDGKTSVDFKSYIEANFGDEVSFVDGEEITTLLVKKENTLKMASSLKDWGFNHLSDVTVVDYIDEGEFELIYHLWSHGECKRLMLKTRMPRDKATIDTLTPIWISAHMHERENHEMFGIKFEGHTDLLPLLLEDWDGLPPLRKDFDSRKFVLEEFYGGERE